MPISLQQREAIVTAVLAHAWKIMQKKGKGYAGDIDLLANFKQDSNIGCTKYQSIMMGKNKQDRSIANSVGRDPGSPTICDGEPMLERICDSINYALLLAMALEEDGILNLP